MSAVDYENDSRNYDDDRGYEREDGRSPRGDMRSGLDSRARSASPGSRGDGRPASDGKDDPHTQNPGTNLFVTGINPKLSEADVSKLFEPFGEVDECKIMRDPHTGDSRGFGFVKMVTADQADAARDGLQGQVHEGRTLSIEKARRNKPRTPTPGKYYGPPKRGEFGGRRGGGGGRFDDRRGGYGRRDDYYSQPRGGSRYNDRHEDRPDPYYERRYRDRADYGRDYGRDYPRGERYGGGGGGGAMPPRDDRYAREDRGYGGGREERRDYGGRGGGDRGGYDQPPPRDGGRDGYGGGGGRGYDDRGDERHAQ